jgi:hypothetical protein
MSVNLCGLEHVLFSVWVTPYIFYEGLFSWLGWDLFFLDGCLLSWLGWNLFLLDDCLLSWLGWNLYFLDECLLSWLGWNLYFLDECHCPGWVGTCSF